MSQYTNKFTIRIGEVVRLIFIDEYNNIETEVCHVTMHVGALKVLRDTISSVIEQHEARLIEQKEINKSMN